MKKILILAILLASTISGFSQVGSYPGYPLYGTSPSQDRTYRSLQLGTTTITDTLGATIDTVQIIPGFVSGAGAVFHKDYILTLKDSCVLSVAKLSSSYEFSTITIYVSAPALSGKIKFLGFSGLATQWALAAAATSVSPTASHWFIITFTQIGTVWAETYRSQD